MLEKNKLIAEVDIEECFEFMRFCYKDRPLEVKKSLEGAFDKIKQQAGISLICSLKSALMHPAIDSGDFFMGMVSGIALALSSARPSEEGNVREFLAEYWKKGNVADISDAFRSRGDNGAH